MLVEPFTSMPAMTHPAGNDRALHLLQTVFGYPAFRGQQADIVNHVIHGGDALVLMPTGGGKSMCYQIPAILRPGVGIVVSPLIALMKNQVDALRLAGVRAAYINSSMPASDASSAEQAMQRGEYDLVYVAPERLVTERFLGVLRRTQHAAAGWVIPVNHLSTIFSDCC